MSAFFKMISKSLRKKIINFLRAYVQQKSNKDSDVCAVFGYGDLVYWETTTSGGMLLPEQKVETMVRGLVGQNVLHRIGIPQEENDIPIIYLVVFPSVMRVLGIKRMFALIRKWTGQSTALNVDVVRYKLFGQRK